MIQNSPSKKSRSRPVDSRARFQGQPRLLPRNAPGSGKPHDHVVASGATAGLFQSGKPHRRYAAVWGRKASSTPFHLRRINSARFSARARARRPGHNSMVERMLRPAASKTWRGAGLKRPPVEAATWRNNASLLPYSSISSSWR